MVLDVGEDAAALPALFTPNPAVARRTVELFTSDIRNPQHPQGLRAGGG